jgi:hypothetical protein
MALTALEPPGPRTDRPVLPSPPRPRRDAAGGVGPATRSWSVGAASGRRVVGTGAEVFAVLPLVSCASGEPDRSAPIAEGAAGRPGPRSGDVTIEWDVTWQSNLAGTGGTVAAEPGVTPFQRIVDEVLPVVDGAGG